MVDLSLCPSVFPVFSVCAVDVKQNKQATTTKPLLFMGCWEGDREVPMAQSRAI